LDVFQLQVIVLSEDLLRRPTARQKVHDELDGNSRAFADGLSPAPSRPR
jgi:hypothetical protein